MSIGARPCELREELVNVNSWQELVQVNWQEELVNLIRRQELIHVNWQEELVNVDRSSSI